MNPAFFVSFMCNLFAGVGRIRDKLSVIVTLDDCNSMDAYANGAHIDNFLIPDSDARLILCDEAIQRSNEFNQRDSNLLV